MRLIFVFMLFAATFIGRQWFAQAQETAALGAIRTLADNSGKAETGGIDFETYQRNIDDIFQLALLAGPGSVDYGINSVIVDLNRQITADPKNSKPLISLGHVYRILGQPAEANRFYAKALALDPQNFHLNMFSALTHAQQENHEQALLELDKALELNASDIYAWMARGRIAMLLKRTEEAEESFKKVIEVQPENKQAVFVLSLVYQRMGRNEEALKLIEDLKRRYPQDGFLNYHLGALSFAVGKMDEGLARWEELFRSGVRDSQFLFNLTIAYLKTGQGEKAERILEHLNFFFPRESDVELLLAEAYRQMNLLDEAERKYRLFLTENPGYLSAYIGLAHVLEQQGKDKERAEVLQQAESYAEEFRMIEREKQANEELTEQIMQFVTEPE